MMMQANCDVCLLLEGTYPYVRGGVSSWTDELIKRQEHLNFHIISMSPPGEIPERLYDLPNNVVGLTDVVLQHDVPKGGTGIPGTLERMKPALQKIMTQTASLDDFALILSIINDSPVTLGYDYLLNSREAWDVLTQMYREDYNESSILDYFWSWRAMMGNLLSVIHVPLPKADAYHCLCTGYAGMLAARAKIETGKPVYLTEHGIYTNERRIEIVSADWLLATASKRYTIDHTMSNLRDLWLNTFSNYSRICYEACDKIITLYEGNQIAQREDGATDDKMMIIPNGVDIERFQAIENQRTDTPTIALIGRVVPIKDVKTFIRACAIVREQIPGLKAYMMGPTDEDKEYFTECRDMVEHYGLKDHIEFTGNVNIDDYLPTIDVVVITSISEAQPLVILEAGACGIPTVATNVGSCQELINGLSNESPALQTGGVVTPLANPTATAQGIIRLLSDDDFYADCATATRERVAKYYDKKDQHAAYRTLYASANKK